MRTRHHPAPSDLSSLGARLTADGVGFGVWAPGASRVELVLISADGGRAERSLDCRGEPDGTWWRHVDGLAPGQRYGFRVHGTWDPTRGLRANPAKLLLDPCARAVTGSLDLTGPVRDHVEGDTDRPDTRDSLPFVPHAVVVAPHRRPTPLTGPRTSGPVVYEAHLRGMTMQHPDVPEELRGTYAGLAHPAVVDHLLRLGVTAVQLLPVQQFLTEPHLHTQGLSNYWGYNTLAFFAPHAGYSSRGSTGGQVQDFADLVSALHAAGIEVLLDVVFNHTAEGDQLGPTLSQRGLANRAWYRLDEQAHQLDPTGCGNAVDTSEPGVLAFVLECLRYWVTELGVDGFRFDLATTLIRDGDHRVDLSHPFLTAVAADPVLAGVRLISESWDLGADGYQVGRFGEPWLEWNDRYRGLVRDFWAGRAHGVAELATRLQGSTDLFDPVRRPATASLNLITAHDGFTLRDLVSYERKHNEANGEQNRDGTEDHRSVNHGVEGETDEPAVRAARHAHVRHLMATLLLSAGTPMITAGDELGRTQQGNNNAYCQDNELSWTDWSDPWTDVTELTSALLRLRRDHPVLRPVAHAHGEPVLTATGAPTGRPELAWLSGPAAATAPGGITTLDVPGWHDPHRRLLGLYLSDATEALLVWFHAGSGPTTLALPTEPLGADWRLLLDTGGGAVRQGDRLRLPGSAVVVLHCPR